MAFVIELCRLSKKCLAYYRPHLARIQFCEACFTTAMHTADRACDKSIHYMAAVNLSLKNSQIPMYSSGIETVT